MSRKSNLAAQCDPNYARHQTFHPRYGWLKRAFDEIHLPDDDTLLPPGAQPTGEHGLFYSDIATTRLGVGKNMVEAIRFWATSSRLLGEIPDPGNRRRRLAVPTVTGHALLADDGYDPYMERPGTWWITHWLLVAPGRERDTEPVRSQVPAWWAMLHMFPGTTFSQDEMVEYLVPALEAEFGKRPNSNSVKRKPGTRRGRRRGSARGTPATGCRPR